MNHLVTPRLLMRPFTESDFDDLFSLCSDTEAMRYTPPYRRLTSEETAGFLHKVVEEFTDSGYGIFAVIERKEKRFIGQCGLYQLPGERLLSGLDFIFTTDAIVKGYAVEAVMAIMRSAFNDWAMERIIAWCPEENKAFIHVLERIGMRSAQHKSYQNGEMLLYSLEKPKDTADSIFQKRYQNSPSLSAHRV